MKLFITISFLFVFSAKSQSKLDTSKYTIFQFDRNIPLVFGKGGRTTVLTPDEINKAEQVLIKCIFNYNIQQQKYSIKAKKLYPD